MKSNFSSLVAYVALVALLTSQSVQAKPVLGEGALGKAAEAISSSSSSVGAVAHHEPALQLGSSRAGAGASSFRPELATYGPRTTSIRDFAGHYKRYAQVDPKLGAKLTALENHPLSGEIAHMPRPEHFFEHPGGRLHPDHVARLHAWADTQALHLTNAEKGGLAMRPVALQGPKPHQAPLQEASSGAASRPPLTSYQALRAQMAGTAQKGLLHSPPGTHEKWNSITPAMRQEHGLHGGLLGSPASRPPVPASILRINNAPPHLLARLNALSPSQKDQMARLIASQKGKAILSDGPSPGRGMLLSPGKGPISAHTSPGASTPRTSMLGPLTPGAVHVHAHVAPARPASPVSTDLRMGLSEGSAARFDAQRASTEALALRKRPKEDGEPGSERTQDLVSKLRKTSHTEGAEGAREPATPTRVDDILRLGRHGSGVRPDTSLSLRVPHHHAEGEGEHNP